MRQPAGCHAHAARWLLLGPHDVSEIHHDGLDRARREVAAEARLPERETLAISHLHHERGFPLSAHALERANNIAQALVFGDTEPRGVAFEMLRTLPTEVRSELAEAVDRAWVSTRR